MNKQPTDTEITRRFKILQDDICCALTRADGGGKFVEDCWERSEGGAGSTRLMENGRIIEKGGVNFSAIRGETPERVLKSLGGLPKMRFYATGVSIVIHPHSPMVPIIHMNVRYFQMENGHFWFGGGIDLTPHYVVAEDAHYFHAALKKACDKHHSSYYPKFKRWADEYFFLKHRNETRGIGGIFFDKLSDAEGFTKNERFDFVQEIGRSFAPIYTHFMQKNGRLPFSENQKKWQALRRGRYVEFNLLLDRGTRFGLETKGRTPSILMSMPPQATWTYNHQPEKNSAEARTIELLKKGIDWLGS